MLRNTSVIIPAGICLFGGAIHPYVIFLGGMLASLFGLFEATNYGLEYMHPFALLITASLFYLLSKFKQQLVRMLWRDMPYDMFWKIVALSQIPNLPGILLTWKFLSGIEANEAAMVIMPMAIFGGAIALVVSNLVFWVAVLVVRRRCRQPN